MSFYRNSYLKSDHWQDLRLEKLAKSACRCVICGHESKSNDVHHISYGKSLSDVRPEDLRVVCRACHDGVHEAMELNPSLALLSPQQRWAEAQRIVKEDKKDDSKFRVPKGLIPFFYWCLSIGRPRLAILFALRIKALINVEHEKIGINSENLKRQRAELLLRDGVKTGKEKNWLARYLNVDARTIKQHPDYKKELPWWEAKGKPAPIGLRNRKTKEVSP